tara:strand:- start:56 stop:298 length:243 start_codon:yes stop_codon:yes gene_type:complete
MKTGWNVTIRGFIAVDPNDADTVVAVAEAMKVLDHPHTRSDTEVGAAYKKMLNIKKVGTFINKRDLPVMDDWGGSATTET